jgi:hypothetical protein
VLTPEKPESFCLGAPPRDPLVQAFGRGGVEFVPSCRPAERLFDRLADEALAGVADKDRRAQVEEAGRVGHQLAIVGVRLAEADAGVEANFFQRDAGREQGVAPGRKAGVDFGHHVVIPRLVLHRLRRAPHVHGTDAGAALTGDVEHVGIALQAGHIIDDLGPVGDELQPMGHGGIERVVPAPIGKTVGCDIDDSHQQRPAQNAAGMRQFEPSGAELPVRGGCGECHTTMVTRE